MQVADFVKNRLWDPEKRRLKRSFRQGPSPTQGFADDYAYLIAGLLDLYEASADLQHLAWALQLQDVQDELFWDDQAGEMQLGLAHPLTRICHVLRNFFQLRQM